MNQKLLIIIGRKLLRQLVYWHRTGIKDVKILSNKSKNFLVDKMSHGLKNYRGLNFFFFYLNYQMRGRLI